MHILIVCKANFEPTALNFQKKRSYIFDQVKEIEKQGLNVEVFFIQGKGFLGYFLAFWKLKSFVKERQFDIVHAHYGYSGLLAGLASKSPVMVTYHGTDITEKISNIISFFSAQLADWNIYVSQKLALKSLKRKGTNQSIISCGVDLDNFYPINKKESMSRLGWKGGHKRILFSSFLSNPIKNGKLAKEAVNLLAEPSLELIELKNRTRSDVALMLNACDVLLLTSFSEGSPQIIKEALACNCPIVATDVGDIKELVGDTYNCFVTGFSSKEVADALSLVLNSGKRSNGEFKIKHLDNKVVCKEIIGLYKGLAEKNNSQ